MQLEKGLFNMNIYEKLQAARVELQNKKLKKSGKNKFSGFDYFELSDFLPAINELFKQYKLFSQFIIADNQASLHIIDAEKVEDAVIFSMPTAELELKGCNKLQALGGVNTYLRRYLYLNALEIVEADLFDAEAGKEEKQKPQKQTENNKSEQLFQEMSNPDIDIISGLTGIADIKGLEKYYKEYKEKVQDIKAFNVAVNARKTAIIGG